MDVVVVESPAKARTIKKYLGGGYEVLASFGHVRDLPRKDGSVRPDDDFAMSWEVDAKAKQRIDDIAKAVKGADHLYLATDPDREGEAISWHVREVLDQRKALQGVDVKRVVFHEITKAAVIDAIRHPRQLDQSLVDAYLARRALDYLVGFTLSPVLWRKLPGSRSAGRVQSVALRLVCEREAEIEIFRAQEYWTIEADFQTPRAERLTARLTHLDGAKLDKLSLGTEAAAKDAVAAIEAGAYSVAEVQRKQVKRNPAPPFTTSTLQQEASRKLGFGASRTMRVAQQLYEGINTGGEAVGLITYMRTDSVTMSREAIDACRRLIGADYGRDYVPEAPRIYKTKAKNAQEAHEAIRPTDIFRKPSDVAAHLEDDQRRLYELIWKRTVACEMASAALDQVAVDIASADGRTVLRANGSVIAFDGFLKLYKEDRDDPADEDDDNRLLPRVDKDEAMDRGEVRPEQHFTQPPPRYSEASLVKKLEELGIGRPSTYASILQVLQDRDYVRLDKRRFVPEDRGRVVTNFLTNFFRRYVEYNFTADLENQLDDISGGRIEWKTVLRDFWQAFSQAVDNTKDLTITQVIDALDEALGPHFFPQTDDGADPRRCPTCDDGRLGLKIGKFGGFIGCSNYPTCKYTRALAIADQDDVAKAANGAEARVLGTDPGTGEEVQVKVGPYGPYLQRGENGNGKGKKDKPARVSLPKGMDPETIDFETALKLLALPRDVGQHPQTGHMITAGIGRYGPYIKHERTYKSLETMDDVLTIGLNRSVALLQEAKGANGELRLVGDHPKDGQPVTLHSGRYGPYVKHGRTNASLPKGAEPETVTMEQAVELLAARKARAAEKGGRGAAKSPARKRGTKKQEASEAAGD